MRIGAILSTRNTQNWISWDLVYEWEDDLACHLAVPVKGARNIRRWHERIICNRISKRLFGDTAEQLAQSLDLFCGRLQEEKLLHFDMNPVPTFLGYRSTRSDCIPIIIDFWRQIDLEKFYRAYRNCPLVIISSLEAFNYLKIKGCPLNIANLPLSLSDKHNQSFNSVKKYDVIVAGRCSPVLISFLLNFETKHPWVEYVMRRDTNGQGDMQYVSNKRGVVGVFRERDEFLKLLAESKVALYSTPGMDGGEERTGGFNPVTPRFLELLNARCSLIGRYPANEDSEYFELQKVCTHVSTYSEFETTLLDRLWGSLDDSEACQSILDKHWTSRRAEKLRQMIADNC